MENNPVDKDNMLGALRNFYNMISEVSELGDDVSLPREFIENIVICGMGGSGFTGDLLKVYLQDLPMQIHVIKDYDLPQFVQRKSLVFTISYSGNTEETISAYRSAIRRGCRVISISSGGKLQELAKMNKNPHILVPKGVQPRLSVPYLFIPILNVLSFSGIIDEQDKIVKKTFVELKSISGKIEEGAHEFAAKLKDKVPFIYSSNKMFCIAEKWKTDINENAKTHASYNVFPEFNHNEICGFENPPANAQVIIVSDKEDAQRIKDRIRVFKKLLGQNKVPVTELAIIGENLLTRLFSGILMGLYLSYFLALEYNRNPTPVNIIEKFKKDLA